MLIHKTLKTINISEEHPNENWLEDEENYYLVDDASDLGIQIKSLRSLQRYSFVTKNGKLLAIQKIRKSIKEDKIEELEDYISTLKDQGVEYQGKIFKCDAEAEQNLMKTSMFLDALLPITWYTRNGEQGTIIINSEDEWINFVSVLANKIAEINNNYYKFKYAIENAQTEEEITNISFIQD